MGKNPYDQTLTYGVATCETNIGIIYIKMAGQFTKYFIPGMFVLVLIILGSLVFAAPSSYAPYNSYSKYTRYEGLAGMPVTADVPVSGPSPSVSENSVAGPSVSVSAKGNGNSSSISSSYFEPFATLSPSGINGASPQFATESSSIQDNLKTSGILFPSSVKLDDHYDKFLDVAKNGVDGQNGCYSSGLSNSRGYLCLTPDLIQQLKTRGGNSTGN
jgi:hypothetical protein